MVNVKTPAVTQRRPTVLDMASSWISVFMVFAVFGRVMEVFTPLAVVKPALTSMVFGFTLSVLTGRLTFRDFFGTPEALLMISYCLLGATASLFAFWPGGAFRVWFDMMFFNLVFFLVFNVNIEGERQFGLAGTALIGSAVILGLGTLFINPHVVIETGGIRRLSVGVTYDSNDLGMIMVTCFPLALAYFLNGGLKSKLVTGVSLLIILSTALKTGSRGTLLGLAAVVFGFVIMRTSQISFFRKALVAALALTAITFFAPEDLWIRMTALFEGDDYNFRTDTEVESRPGRLLIWTSGLKLITMKTFLVGVGPGQFGAALADRFGRFFYITAHNSYLQALVELGLFGLVIFTAVQVVILRNCNRAQRLFAEGRCEGILLDLPRYVRLSLFGLNVCVLLLSRAYSRVFPILLVYSSALLWIAEGRCAQMMRTEETHGGNRPVPDKGVA